MKTLIQYIFQSELQEKVYAIHPIIGLGSVNQIFEVASDSGNYIIRLNDTDKRLECKKEVWCINAVSQLGIPVPAILGVGLWGQTNYMIQRKIAGLNGKICTPQQQALIWQKLGEYASIFQSIPQIEEVEVAEAEFHADWKSRLDYNLKELNEADSLLRDNILTKLEHNKAKSILKTLQTTTFKTGLVHGDLCPRNVIVHDKIIYLLDWGTAEINIVPHTEIGIVLMNKEASDSEFQLFLKGLGISTKAYQQIEQEITILNFLHQVDIYRWAESRDLVKVNDYDGKVRRAFDEMI